MIKKLIFLVIFIAVSSNTHWIFSLSKIKQIFNDKNSVWASEIPINKSIDEETIASKNPALPNICSDQKLGIVFACDPNWIIETDSDILLIVIEENPHITLTIVKTTDGPSSIEELTPPLLEEIGNYRDGFKIHNARIAHRDAIMVKGFSKENQNLQMVDFYIINESSLYGFLFSFETPQALIGHANILEEMISSLDFIPHNSDKKI